jgi:hypothetical protein
MSDDFDILSALLGRAIEALAKLSRRPDIGVHLEALERTRGDYVPELRKANVNVALSLRHIEAVLGTLESSVRLLDVDQAIRSSTAMMSALPGNPTTGMRPPKPKNG